MKVLEFNKLKILYANTKYTFYEETAYWANNITSLFSTVFYNITYLLFIEVLFSNTDQIAGYNRDEMLFFYFFAEFAAYSFGIFLNDNLANLIKSINRGTLDLVLVKPVDSLFFLNYWRIKIFSGLRDAIPPLIIIYLTINWQNISLTFLNLLAGITIFIIGMFIIQSLLWIASIPTFWLGEGVQIFNLVQESWFSSGSTIPYEGLSRPIQLFFTFIIPGIIPIALATSVALGKTPYIQALSISLIVLLLFWRIRGYLWKLALRNYTSAGS